MKVALAFFTPGGAALAQRIVQLLTSGDSAGAGWSVGNGCSVSLFDSGAEPVKVWVQREFTTADALVVVGATGIVVRLLDGLMRGKDKDPAVLVLDEAGRFVIPLLSGHMGGANRFARYLAEALGATPVITTATDVAGVFAVDEWAVARNCAITPVSGIKAVSAALLRGEAVGLCSDFPLSGDLPPGLQRGDSGPVGICVTLDAGKKPFAQTLTLMPRILVLGAGCRKLTDSAAFARFVDETLVAHGFDAGCLSTLASIDLKRDEPCLRAFAQNRNLAFNTFTAAALAAVPGTFSASAFVQAVTTVDNVCERAAIAGGGVRLLIPKTARNGMTLALAAQEWTCGFGA